MIKQHNMIKQHQNDIQHNNIIQHKHIIQHKSNIKLHIFTIVTQNLTFSKQPGFVRPRQDY